MCWSVHGCIFVEKKNQLDVTECFIALMIRSTFGPKREEVAGEWRKLHKEELRDLYSLPNIARVVK